MVLTRSVRNILTAMVAFGLLVAAVWVVSGDQARAGASGPVVYVATGEDFPDALGGGPVAAMVKGPLLLVRQDSIPGETAAELGRLAPDKIVIIGGTAVISAGVEAGLGAFATTVERIAGVNRYDTAAQLSAATFPAVFDADTLNGKSSSSFLQHAKIVTSHHPAEWVDNGPTTNAPTYWTRFVDLHESAELGLTAPNWISGRTYGLESVELCYLAVGTATATTRLQAHVGLDWGTVTTDNTVRDSSTLVCYTLTNATPASADSWNIWLPITGGGASDYIRMYQVQATWVPTNDVALAALAVSGSAEADGTPSDS